MYPLTAPHPRKDLRALGLLENQLLRGAEEDAPLVVLGLPPTGVLKVEVPDEHQGHQGLPEAAAARAASTSRVVPRVQSVGSSRQQQRSTEEKYQGHQGNISRQRTVGNNQLAGYGHCYAGEKSTELRNCTAVNCECTTGSIPLQNSRVLDKRLMHVLYVTIARGNVVSWDKLAPSVPEASCWRFPSQKK